MFMHFVRAIIRAIRSVFNKQRSLDSHRVMEDELRPKFYVCEKCNLKVIGYHFTMWFELNSEHYSYYVGVARTEEEFIKQVEHLVTTGGEIGEDFAGEVKYAVPGLTYSIGTCLGEAYEREFPESRISFDR